MRKPSKAFAVGCLLALPPPPPEHQPQRSSPYVSQHAVLPNSLCDLEVSNHLSGAPEHHRGAVLFLGLGQQQPPAVQVGYREQINS